MQMLISRCDPNMYHTLAFAVLLEGVHSCQLRPTAALRMTRKRDSPTRKTLLRSKGIFNRLCDGPISVTASLAIHSL